MWGSAYDLAPTGGRAGTVVAEGTDKDREGGWVHWVTLGLGFSREEQQDLGSGAASDVRLGRS